jgi:hypothetical protein
MTKEMRENTTVLRMSAFGKHKISEGIEAVA